MNIIYYFAVLKVLNTSCVIPVLKMRSTLPANISLVEPVGTANALAYPVKPLAEKRAILSTYIITA